MRTPLIILIMAVAAICSTSVAQRRITPVNPTPTGTRHEAANGKDQTGSEPALPPSVIHYHSPDGKVILIDTVAGTEYVDSAALEEAGKTKGRIYPLMHAVTVGVNIWDPLMRCFGQHYGLADAWVELSLHNWIKPVFEFGLGAADNTPSDGNFTYHSPAAPYFKIGANYNFLYNSNPAYQFLAGLRYGFSSFKYDIQNATGAPGYWDEPTTFNIPRQTSTVGYGEFMIGLKVQIYKNISMGWNLKYHFIFHESKAKYGQPWYIPGYGSRGSAITGAFSIMYTLPLNQKSIPAVDNQVTE
ncbi:MAG: hypothetical protein K2L90_08130 [Muribaculaceae bacterium]|nr:hypothetical protein [Muribaculaceae bacterium]